jgi:hypothetical protein
LVEERTDQLREEKKKTEDILLQMLPQWVLIVVLHFPISIVFRLTCKELGNYWLLIQWRWLGVFSTRVCQK